MTEGWESFATVDPFDGMTATNPCVVLNLVGGEWVSVADVRDDIVDPLNGAEEKIRTRCPLSLIE